MSYDITIRKGMLVSQDQFRQLITESNYRALISTLQAHDCHGDLKDSSSFEETVEMFFADLGYGLEEPLNEWLEESYPSLPKVVDIFKIEHSSPVWHDDLPAAAIYPVDEFLFEFSLEQSVVRNPDFREYDLTESGAALVEAVGGDCDLEVVNYVTMG